MRGEQRDSGAAGRFKAAMAAVEIEDMVLEAVRDGCRLCGRRAAWGATYAPHSRGGRTVYVYALCEKCRRKPGSVARIEAMAEEALEARDAGRPAPEPRRRKRKGGRR
ncbi:MAG: hypothetical protein BGO49_09355 [Planctomycetales bacterium 71-10]|nr:MAG: hypothetical protein BGO49_09355 [Planctomycetales bacterium 71-10]